MSSRYGSMKDSRIASSLGGTALPVDFSDFGVLGDFAVGVCAPFAGTGVLAAELELTLGFLAFGSLRGFTTSAGGTPDIDHPASMSTPWIVQICKLEARLARAAASLCSVPQILRAPSILNAH